MYYERKKLLLTWLLALVGGVLLHFLYDVLPNAVTALLAPVNESLWEHLKVIYWPFLLGALVLTRGRPGGLRPWLLALSLMCPAMLALGYGYHVVLGGEVLAVDLGIYLLVMTLGFWLATRFSGPFTGWKWAVPVVLTAGWGAAILVFTLWPPANVLFTDLSAVRTWLQIPL